MNIERIQTAPEQKLHFLVFAQSTSEQGRRTGIHRTTVELARWLPTVARTDVVKWDDFEGQLAYFGRRDFKNLFRSSSRTEANRVNAKAHRANDRFGNTLDPASSTWLIFPEIPYHLPEGNEMFARIVSQCREYGVRIASVFYDIIPITNRSYSDYRAPHLTYVTELARSDLIVPISQHMGTVLREFYADSLREETKLAPSLLARIRPVSLPEGRRVSEPAASDDGRDTILMVGTVEPRKRQVEALQAINRLARRSKDVARLKVVVIGSLHPDSAMAFHEAVGDGATIAYHDYCSQEFIEQCYQRALFTVFASNDEGYGLPVAESLARGVPCVSADFGSMAEIAEGGGCLAVDVNNIGKLEAAIERISSDPQLRTRLREEIRGRRLRDWADYARDVASVISAAQADESAALEQAREQCQVQPGSVNFRYRDVALRLETVAPSDRPVPAASSGAIPNGLLGVTVTLTAAELETLPKQRRELIYRADAAGFTTRASAQGCAGAAQNDGFPELLPGRVVVNPSPTELRRRVWDQLCELADGEARKRRLETDERILMALTRRWRQDMARSRTLLTIMVSTYNRSAFVWENVNWILRNIKKYGDKVELVVVDNASTDDSWERLRRLEGTKQLRLLRNPSNTGMLGNLHVCSTLRQSRHIWVTGDDDFIVPAALETVLEILDREPSLPLLVANFAVYYRDRLRPGDEAAGLIAEGNPLAPTPSRSGQYRLNRIAAEHDNLFTAIYPLVFRSDVLAACFNYPFTGIPFGDLVESVPTTKLLLESYGYCPAYWLETIGIVGNAHNSWTRHRPRWHGLLMPLVFELARESGVDRGKLYRWAQIHKDLLQDALRIAKEDKLMVHLDDDGDLEAGSRVFRAQIQIPPDLLRWTDPHAT